MFKRILLVSRPTYPQLGQVQSILITHATLASVHRGAYPLTPFDLSIDHMFRMRKQISVKLIDRFRRYKYAEHYLHIQQYY